MTFFGGRLVSVFAIACAAKTAACAQVPARHHFSQSLAASFVWEVKAGPNGGPYYPFLNNASGFTIDYWFQPRPWLALEAGFDQIVRPLGSSICCRYATNANDELFLVPFGARYVWEPRSTRLRVSAGGGGAYLNHAIGDHGGGTDGFYGWGGQFVVSGGYTVTRSGRLRLGVTARYYFA